MGKYRVVVERSERISYLIAADTAEDAEERYLMDGDEDWSKTLGTVVTAVEQMDAAAHETSDAEIGAGVLDDPSTPARREQDEDVDADLPDLLVRELRVSNPKEFGRPAMPSVYAEYAALKDAAPGGMVYNAEAQAYFTERHEIPEELLKHLDHEIYLASGQYRLAQMVADEQAARAEGWVAVTEVEPADGMVLDIRGRTDGPFRATKIFTSNYPWALLPKGKRTHGYHWQGYVRQHRAYEKAKERGQVDLDGPAVVMVRIVKKGN